MTSKDTTTDERFQDWRCLLPVSCLGIAAASATFFLATRLPFPAFAGMVGHNPVLVMIGVTSATPTPRRAPGTVIRLVTYGVGIGVGILIGLYAPAEPEHAHGMVIVTMAAFAFATYVVIRVIGRALYSRCARSRVSSIMRAE